MSDNVKFDQRKMEIVVGAFAICIFASLFIFTVIINQDSIFTRKPMMTVIFREDVNGLNKGHAVIVRGMEIGKVGDLALKEDGVHVNAVLDEAVPLYEDYKITVIAASVLGGRQLLIEQGSGPALHEGPIIGTRPLDLMAESTALIHDLKVSLTDGGVLTNLQAIAKDLRGVSEKLNGGEGTIGKLINDDSVYQDLKTASSSLKDIATNLSEGKGSLGRLLSDDDSLYKDLASVAENLNVISTRLADGKGTLGKLLAEDETMYKDLQSAVASIREVADKLASTDGTLGKLINDDAVYREAQQVIGDVRAAIDDFRETAPVITFTSILFGAF
jgi:phospholipid/cholesterol/gamma-HCH transport system substrate-binding protein